MNNVVSSGKRILVCCGTGCQAKCSMQIYDEFRKQLQVLNGIFQVKAQVKLTGCNGLCERGPMVKIYPDDISYYKVQVKDVAEIIEKTVIGSETVERLLYRDKKTGKYFRSQNDTVFFKGQKRIALRNIGEIDPESIEDYIGRGGYSALKKVLFQMRPEEVIDTIKESGLRGRGGAGFPAGYKWEACRRSEETLKYVVCNGNEGDPDVFIDRCIMEGDPNSIIEGMIIGAYAVGAKEGYIYIRDGYQLAIDNMYKAIEEAEKNRFLGKDILGSGMDFKIIIIRSGGAFVCGESTALIASIEGKKEQPRAEYTHCTQKGLWAHPTVLNNVETWVNIPEIILKGAEWFREIGTEDSKGTKVFSLLGDVNNKGLAEVSMDTSLRELIYSIGGGIPENRRFKAVQTGGPSGGFIPLSYLDVELDFQSLEEAGSIMGSGGLYVMDDRTCMVETAKNCIKFLAAECCGKCVPCKDGLRYMLETLERITSGKGGLKDINLLLELGEMMGEASLCALGKTAPNPVITTIRHFTDEYLEHIVNKSCRTGTCKALISTDRGAGK